MPVHDWTRVYAGIFHAFHHGWIEEISRALNRGILPADYYALPEQHAAGFGPDVLTLQAGGSGTSDSGSAAGPSGSQGAMLAPSKLQPVAETDLAFYRGKQKSVTVRHASGDQVVAMVEIVSPGNKSSRSAIRAFVQKAADLLEQGIHLLIIDLHPPGRRDPQGIHAAIWEEIAGDEAPQQRTKPFTLVAYESGLTVRAYLVSVALGESLAEMPLFLEPGQSVDVPLESTYQAAFAEVPRRWRQVLEA